METPSGQTILSGIQPSGSLHIGNYLGAIKQWVALQENNDAYYCIVDLHAITVPYEPEDLKKNILDTAALYLASGLDPEKSTIFIQSHVPAHTELAWLLATQTPMGELSRMTQFKDKSAKQTTELLGLFSYPILMAADILLYQADIVPVGDDQVQHIELARDTAKRFNNKLGDTFTIPEPLINKDTARIMSLTDPATKMSKSDADKSYIAITDDSDTTTKKIMKATTETEANIQSDTPSITNLLNIYSAASGEDKDTIVNRYDGKGFKEFKEDLAQEVIKMLSPIQQKYQEIRSNEDNLREILATGAANAKAKADTTLNDAKQKMGL